MANEVNQSSFIEQIENKNWKNRCIKLLKQVEKKNLSAKGDTDRSSVLLKERNEAEEKLKIIEDKIADAIKQLNEISIEKGDKLTNSSVLKLYELITKLTFDIESPPNEVKGSGKCLEAFQFDVSQHSKQFIIDHLWYLINLQLKQKEEKV